ncbi:MAG: AraC family transcriptional regulator [Anaerocolumna sp.]|jgi:hypothetical protein|nr:AraC family transcriptional regulator [Anaerocolumna sp.]
MDIILNQKYEISDLISYSGRFTATEFQKKIIEMVNNYKDIALRSGEYMITVTKSVEFVNGEQVMDVEILLPVNCRITATHPYRFKDKLRLTNALLVNVTKLSYLQETLEQVDSYIMEHKLKPITSAYLVQTKRDNLAVIDIYVGINPNIL